MALDYDFKENLKFEKCNSGFRFGNEYGMMFFIPCYSCQNGYYTNELDIYYNYDMVIKGIDCDIEEN